MAGQSVWLSSVLWFQRVIIVAFVFLSVVGSKNVFALSSADLGLVVVTPQRYVQDAAQAESYVSVITAQDIAASGSFDLPDVLNRQAGVHVYNKGSAKNAVIDIGGYNDFAVSNVLVLLNGRRLNASDMSGPDLAQIPLDIIDHIEIVRGAGSILYGDNAVAGVVNIITRKGTSGLSGSVNTEMGSYGRRKSGVNLSAGKGTVQAYIFGGTQETNGYRANNRYRSGDGQARVDWQVTPLLTLGLETGWHEDDYGLPSGLSMTQINNLGRRGTRKPLDYGDTRDRFIRFFSAWTPGDEEGRYGTVSAEYAHRDRDTYAFFDYADPNWDYTKIGIRTDSLGLKYLLRGDLWNRSARLTTGVDLSDDRGHTLYQYNDLTFPAYQDVLVSKRERGTYVRGEYELFDNLTADFGGRYQQAKYVFHSYHNSSTASTSPTETVWGGGLKYDYAEGSNVFARVDETFRFLNTDEWFSRWTGLNTTLRNQSGLDYRTGVRHAWGPYVEGRATVFMTRNKDEIFFDPTAGGGFGNNANYGRTHRMGLDVGQTFHTASWLKIAWLKTADWHWDYTYAKAQFDGGSFAGNQLPLSQKHKITAGCDFSTRGGFSWNLAAHFLGSSYGINDALNVKPKVKPSFVVDTRFGYIFRKQWEGFAGINNIFNERYYDYVAYGTNSSNVDYYPASNRNYVVGVKYSF